LLTAGAFAVRLTVPGRRAPLSHSGWTAGCPGRGVLSASRAALRTAFHPGRMGKTHGRGPRMG